jgi:hypothetical protein
MTYTFVALIAFWTGGALGFLAAALLQANRSDIW